MSRDAMDCNELVELVTAYLDGSLDPGTRARFDEHLLGCDGCQAYLEQFRVTIRTIGKVTDEQLDPVFRVRLLDAFRDQRSSTAADRASAELSRRPAARALDKTGNHHRET